MESLGPRAHHADSRRRARWRRHARAWGKAASRSKGKDTSTGPLGNRRRHHGQRAADLPKGAFRPRSSRLSRRALGKTLANDRVGTQIIEEYGEETCVPVSRSSPRPIRCSRLPHTKGRRPRPALRVVPHRARNADVGCVIARPFVGAPGSWQRQSPRLLAAAAHWDDDPRPPLRSRQDVVSVGKISDIRRARRDGQPPDQVERRRHRNHVAPGANAGPGLGDGSTKPVDFDMKYGGHRRDVVGYQRARSPFRRAAATPCRCCATTKS